MAEARQNLSGRPRVAVTFSPAAEMRDAIVAVLEGVAEVDFTAEAETVAEAVASADAVLALHPEREFDLGLLRDGTLLQLLSAGAEHVPVASVPGGVVIASNVGAYADPIAEHVLAMVLALAKRLLPNQAALARGEFDQDSLTIALRGAVVGVVGFGGIGQACASLFSAFGARIYAVNRSGAGSRPVEFVGTLDQLDVVLAAADVVVLALPLTRFTRGLIGARELSLMKPDAILVNVARAGLVDEDALYEHLAAHPSFCAGIDTWWQEQPFAVRRPFFDLPNVLGSPHNSGMTPGAMEEAARWAALNVARYLRGEGVRGLVDRSEYG